MTRILRPTFAFGDRFVAARPLTVGGVILGVGDPVDIASFTPRRAKQLYEARHIERAEFLSRVLSPAPEGGPTTSPIPPTQTEHAGEGEGAGSGEPAPKPTPRASGGWSVRHRGFGRWYVMRGEEAVDGPHADEAAALASMAKVKASEARPPA